MKTSTLEMASIIMESVGSLIAWIGRFFMLCGLVAIPWCMGGRNPTGILLVSIAVVISLMCALVSRIFLRNNIELPNVIYPVLACLIYCGLQAQSGVFPEQELSFGKPAEFWHNLMKLPPEEKCEIGPIKLISQTISISRYETLTQVSMGLIALCAGVTCCCLFSRWNDRLLLFWVIGLNGTAMSIFGLYQKATWNGKIYWMYPFPGNANPFGSFVNRNNAAGYLNITLACLVGLVVYYLIKNCPLGLSLIRTEQSQKKLDLKTTELASYLVSGIDLAVIASALGLAGIVAGVLVAQSRAGVLSVGAGLLIAAFLVSKRLRAGNLLLPAMALLLGIMSTGILWWLTPEVDVFKRIEGTNLEVISNDARWKNWADASNTLTDHWLWGTGLKSYQFAHKPYQSFNHDYWFYHAENQYLQLAIETGVVGMFCQVAFIFCWYLGLKRLITNPAYLSRESIALLVISVIVGISQAIQAVVDFGLYHQASLLTGLVLACVTLTKPVVDQDVYNVLNQEKENKDPINMITPLILLSALCVSAIPSMLHLTNLNDSKNNQDHNIINFKTWELTDQQHAARRQYLSSDESMTTLNPEYHVNRVRALFEEYAVRRADAVRVNQNQYGKATDSLILQHSSLFLLRKLVVNAELINDSKQLQLIKNDSDIKELLIPAISHLQRAIDLNPLDWRAHKLALLLEPLVDTAITSRVNHARDTLRLNPSDPELCYIVGLVAFQDQADQLSMQAFRLSLTLSEEQLTNILAIALTRYRFTQIMEKIIPPDPAIYLQISQLKEVPGLTSLDRRYAAIKALEQLEAVPEKNRTWEEYILLGQGYQIAGEFSSAAKILEKLLVDMPLSIDGRVLLADVYISMGNIDKAFELIISGLKFSTDQKLQSKLAQIEKLLKVDKLK